MADRRHQSAVAIEFGGGFTAGHRVEQADDALPGSAARGLRQRGPADVRRLGGAAVDGACEVPPSRRQRRLRHCGHEHHAEQHVVAGGCQAGPKPHQAGGVVALKALAGPFADVRFCPTGGIDAAKAPAYLALRNVATVGGSWMVPADALAARDWARIGASAREAAGLRSR